jgi:uncharacterized membrane protein YebE (DUF533 family)
MLGWWRARLAAGGCYEVEPVSLTVGAVVAALVLKGAEKTGEKVTDGGLAAIGRLVDRVRARFRHRKDADAEKALARVEDPPAGPTQLAALAAAVDSHAGEDAAFAAELHRLVQHAEAAGVEVQNVTQVAWGSQIVQNQDVEDSSITVTFSQPPG